MTASRLSSSSIGGNLVAIVLALIVFTVVALLVAVLISIGDTLFTVMRPGIIGFFAAIAGAVAGVTAARSACDTVVKSYHPRAVFGAFALLAVAGCGYEFFALPFELGRITPIAQMIVTAGVAWETFWRSDPT